ncbi:hypothetical protein PHYSODRAFT_332394 [Phytophthora sojae]|uniref:FYVE-type domain-containing protein n=1 Tax=Phytophthora sojae (strain P6497) TaxID=1094619 RepID=G4ZH25_PHYSP|nr:hypothetical protein PHYSODRAFT_332394 [Phytophthora sojae]EGZ18650.1 hypothetical protein PHYSODRAFT_332394 [Phytophthora sojae]|eukprot:XP_009527708.1 hypothetical protein PHYSODRAFT_332394 [Phytophthora sojae]
MNASRREPPHKQRWIELSEDQQKALIEEADTVVKEIVAANDAFIADGGVLRDPQWRLIRTKEGMHVYRQRRKAIKQRGKESSAPVIESPSWSSSQTLSRYRPEISSQEEPCLVSLMALHGTTDGTLDDCMFGCFIPNNEEWKLRSSYINDGIDDSRFAKEHPAVLTGIVQQRDFLILESLGFMRDCNGEKVGYFLMHSVALREIPELSHLNIVRGLMSFCYVFRQGKPGKVDIYTRGFFDSRGEMPGRLSVAIAADAALCCVNLIQYAYIKKLTWLMKHSGHGRSGGHATQSTHCEACEKSFSKFSLTHSGSGTACSICRRVVCSKCSVLKKMVMDVSDTGSVQHCSFQFCLRCLLKTKKQCGWEIALSGSDTAS